MCVCRHFLLMEIRSLESKTVDKRGGFKRHVRSGVLKRMGGGSTLVNWVCFISWDLFIKCHFVHLMHLKDKSTGKAVSCLVYKLEILMAAQHLEVGDILWVIVNVFYSKKRAFNSWHVLSPTFECCQLECLHVLVQHTVFCGPA